MASPSRRKRIRINLLCTKCERQFEDWACFVSIEIADSGTLEWMPADNATMGTKCPGCGSEAIVVDRP
jgi:DNA-directed RNA polymerase subunit RPC12/RpoP